MFKQITSAALAASVLMSSSAVMANDWFVGATLGSADQEVMVHEDGEKSDGQIKDSYTGFRAGTFINDNIRLYANLGRVKGSERVSGVNDDGNQLDMNTSVKNEELSFSVDYVDNLFQLENTKYFVGGTLGYNRMKVDITYKETGSSTDKASKKDNSALYGVQLGLIQEFTTSISGELGYRYASLDNKVSFGEGDDSLELKQKNQKMVYINLSYQF